MIFLAVAVACHGVATTKVGFGRTAKKRRKARNCKRVLGDSRSGNVFASPSMVIVGGELRAQMSGINPSMGDGFSDSKTVGESQNRHNPDRVE
jgi:hypothetical protein